MTIKKTTIDAKVRICQSGLSGQCMGTFTMRDYPPGYFAYKYELKSGSRVNTCPRCEVEVQERVVRTAREADPLTISARSQRDALEVVKNIELLRTGRIKTDRHRKQALHTHGWHA